VAGEERILRLSATPRIERSTVLLECEIGSLAPMNEPATQEQAARPAAVRHLPLIDAVTVLSAQAGPS
jgi:hypothetical protein